MPRRALKPCGEPECSVLTRGRYCGDHQLTMPEWMPRAERPVTIVAGPIGSGKTTYARNHADPGDEIVDLDDIACELSGHQGHDWSRPRWLYAALRERNRRISEWSRPSRHRGWLIVTDVRAGKWWRDRLEAELVVLQRRGNGTRRTESQDSVRS